MATGGTMKLAVAAALVAGVSLGTAGTLTYLRYSGGAAPKAWYTLKTEGDRVGYATEAWIGVDVPLPKIGSITGEARFIQTAETNSVQFGYRVAVPVASLDVSKVPAKYLARVKHPDGSETLPIDEVVYQVLFTFRLRDSDGFILRELKSEPHYIYSGKTNQFQSIISEGIPVSAARSIRAIDLGVSVQRCETCR